MNNCFHLVFIYINSYKNQNNYSVNEKKSGDFFVSLLRLQLFIVFLSKKAKHAEYYILQNTSNTHLANRIHFCSRHFLYLLYFRNIAKITIQAEMIRWQPLNLRPL